MMERSDSLKTVEVQIRYPNSQSTVFIDVPDDATPKEIHDIVIENILSTVSFDWHVRG